MINYKFPLKILHSSPWKYFKYRNHINYVKSNYKVSPEVFEMKDKYILLQNSLYSHTYTINGKHVKCSVIFVLFVCKLPLP